MPEFNTEEFNQTEFDDSIGGATPAETFWGSFNAFIGQGGYGGGLL